MYIACIRTHHTRNLDNFRKIVSLWENDDNYNVSVIKDELCIWLRINFGLVALTCYLNKHR